MFLFGFAAVKLYRGDGKSTLLRDRNEQYFHTIRDNTQQDTIQNNVFESLLLSWQLFKHSLFAIYTRYPNEKYLFFMPRTNNYQTTFNRTSIDAQKLFIHVTDAMKVIDKFKIPFYPYNVIITSDRKVEYVSDYFSFNILKKLERRIEKNIEGL